jgi:hypothetical protein
MIMLLKYMELNEIILKLMSLSKHFRETFMSENYLIFKQFIRLFNLHPRMKRSKIPANIDVFTLIKENLLLKNFSKIENLHPFAYNTDGGTYQNSTRFFLQNIFSKSGVCHSTRINANSNIQSYLGRRVHMEEK